MSSLAFDDLEEAIPADADVPFDIRVEGILAGGHQNPIFAFDVLRQAGARHSR
jgi:hypothetical protein